WERATLDQPRAPPLLEADLDDLEVPGHDRVREDGTRLARRFRSEIAAREVNEREHADLRLACELGGLAGGRVRGLVRALPLVLEEGRFVDQQVGPACGFENGRRDGGIPGDNDRPAGARVTEDLIRSDDATVYKRQCRAALEHPALGPRRYAERVGRGDVEASRSVVLDQRVADRRDAVRDPERGD